MFFFCTELNAAHNPGSSSGSGSSRPTRRRGFLPGEKHPDPLPRHHDETACFMGKYVRLWIANGDVVQANFDGMQIPTSYSARAHNYLVRIDEILGYPTVIYVYQNETLMAVRARKPKGKGQSIN